MPLACWNTPQEPSRAVEEARRLLTVLPAGFADETVFSGLTLPTSVRFASDGRVFVAQKNGEIWVYPSLGAATRTLVADLKTQVQSFWDRGLLGFELDPNFPASPNLYVLYAFDADVGGTPPKWGDTCPTPPGATDDGCTIAGRLSRLTLAGDVMTSEQVLIEAWSQQYPSHSIGSLVFGQDGALYLSAGDGASFNFVDYGQDGSPVNPLGDPPGGAPGTVLTPPTAEGGALRSQSLRRVAGPALLNGAILRLDPATGAPMASNPYIGSSDVNARRIVAYGLRNPFRMTRRPGTNELYAGDVGWGTWEEIDRVADPVDATVENFGWPCYEGDARQGGYEGANLASCANLYAAGASAHAQPLFAYRHGVATMPGDTCPTNGSSSITGLAFYDGGKFPAQYQGALFFSDYSRRCIWAMLPGTDGVPDKTRVVNFWRAAAAGDPSPVELTMGRDGALYYVDHVGGRIQRLRYQSPTAVIAGNPLSGPGPLGVTFSSAGSGPGVAGETVTYAWDLDGDGQFDDGSSTSPAMSYGVAGSYTIRLKVTDARGVEVVSQPVVITVTSTPPPTAIASGTPLTGPAPLTVNLSSMGSAAAGFGEALVYAWDLDGDGEFDDSSSALPVVTYPTAGTTTVRLRVTDPRGASTVSEPLTVTVSPAPGGGGSNTAPEPAIDSPVAGTSWVVGDTVYFAGHATDAQDGSLLPAQLTWQLIVQHCPDACHAHVVEERRGVSSGTFAFPDHEYPMFVELKLIAIDSNGVSASALRRLDAKTVTLDLASVPPGLTLSRGSGSQTAPYGEVVMQGSSHSVSAPSPQTLGGITYDFVSWSDGLAASHNLTVSASTTLTATFAPRAVVGTGTGLQGEYSDNIDFTGAKLTRTDATVDFDWGNGAPDPTMGADTFSVRWTGQIMPQFSETYAFHTSSDDGVRLWVDGQLIVDNWTDHAPTENTGSIALVAGQKVDVKMEFYERGGGAVAKLSWSSPSTSRVTVPQSQLFPPPVPGSKANGAACAAAAECASGLCVDGVCCNAACTGGCSACNVAGSVGTCAAIVAGQDPKNACATAAVTTCGQDGTCDGAGACRLYAAGTECQATGCASGSQTSVRTCDGAGVCQSGTSAACAPYVCGPTACLTACTSNVDCASGSACVAGACQALLANGAACTQSSQCGSGFCVDGVCCNTGCTGGCFACSLAGSVGTCAAIASGQDPKNACAAGAAATCGQDGTCDGAGACRLYAAGTECQAPGCASGSQRSARTCDGAGVCQAATSAACAPYVCGPSACLTACTSNAECASGNTCIAGVCQRIGGTGLRAHYFDNKDLTAWILTRTDATVDFSWGSGSPAASIGVDTFSVRWTGLIEPKATETVTFYTSSDDGVRLWVNNVQVINNWTDHGTTENAGSVALTVGVKVPITMEYYENGGGAVARLLWSSPSIAKQVVPQSALHPTRPGEGSGTGLQSEYFDNKDFTGTKVTRRDPEVNFAWGKAAPASTMGVDTFSARWTGKILPRFSETYTFFTTSDDGVRVWVNNVQVINNWTDHAPVENAGMPIALTAGTLHDIRVEYYENTGGATAKLSWSSASTPKAVVPQAQLYPPGTTTP